MAGLDTFERVVRTEFERALAEFSRRGRTDALEVVTLLETRVLHAVEALRPDPNATVPPRVAAQISGYHTNSLARFQREGRLKNHGTHRRPRYRVSELPIRPG